MPQAVGVVFGLGQRISLRDALIKLPAQVILGG
jgi:hypothetical protein